MMKCYSRPFYNTNTVPFGLTAHSCGSMSTPQVRFQAASIFHLRIFIFFTYSSEHGAWFALRDSTKEGCVHPPKKSGPSFFDFLLHFSFTQVCSAMLVSLFLFILRSLVPQSTSSIVTSSVRILWRWIVVPNRWGRSCRRLGTTRSKASAKRQN